MSPGVRIDGARRIRLPDTLVVAGGGLRGVHGLGALAHLRRAGMLASVRRVVGTSSGAILGAMLATDQLERGLGLVLRQKGGWDIQLHKLPVQFGIDSGKMLDELIGALFEQTPDITFEQLHVRTGIDLHVCATDLQRRSAVYFCKNETPHMSVALAVRHSCTIPTMFAVKRDEKDDGVFVDGGVVANFPMRRGRMLSLNGRVLGVCYSTPRDRGAARIADLRSFLEALMECTTSPCESSDAALPGELILTIESDPVAIEFDADARKRYSWFLEGAQQAKEFLKKIQ